MGRYYTQEALSFSALYGGAVYQQTGETADPLQSGPALFSSAPGGKSPVLKNLTTGEAVYLRRLDCGDRNQRDTLFRMVLHPPAPGTAHWPVDVIPLSEDLRRTCTLYVDRIYRPEGRPADTAEENAATRADAGEAGEERVMSDGNRKKPPTGGSFAAVFPLVHFSALRDGPAVLEQLGERSWRNSAIRSLAVRLAAALDWLNRDGYSWYEFHPSRFFFREDGQMFFDFSSLAVPAGEAAVFFNGWNYPVEFADPAVIRGLVPGPDRQSQNYSLCAFLFWLLFGRYPCDGALLSGSPDDSPLNHYVKFRDYHRMPIFLFDRDDRQNAPGIFAEDDALLELWAACPEELRRMFTDTLSCRNAERQGKTVQNPSPGDFLDCFRHIGWLDK